MPKLQIDGVGTVQVDDSFNHLSPEDQQSTVEEIAAQAKGQAQPQPSPSSQQYEVTGPDGRTYDVTAPAGASQADVLKYVQANASAAQPQPSGTTALTDSGDDGSPALMPRDAFRSEYQRRFDAGASQADLQGFERQQGYEYDPAALANAIRFRDKGGKGAKIALPNARNADRIVADTNVTSDGAGVAALGLTNAVLLNHLPQASAALETVIPGTGRPNVWNGHGLSDAYGTNVDADRGIIAKATAGHEGAYDAGSLAGMLVPGLGTDKLVSKVIGKQALGKLARMSGEGALQGGIWGEGDVDGDLDDHLTGFGTGAVAGAALGAAGHVAAPYLTKVAEKVSPRLTQANFERAQADNLFAAHDAKVATDVQGIMASVPTRTSTGQRIPAAQRDAIVSDRLDTLAKGYLPREDIRALDIPTSEKNRLGKAMDNALVLSPDDVNDLRGTPHGDAVADGITNLQRLRAAVPEASTSVRSPNVLRSAVLDAGAGALSSYIGGPVGAGSTYLARQAISKGLSMKRAPQAALAKLTAQQAPRFARMADRIDPSAATASLQALSAAADTARDAPALARRAVQAAKARQALEDASTTAANRRVGIANDLDNVRPQGGWRGYVYDRTGLLPKDQDTGALKLLAKGRIEPQHFDAFLRAPEKLQAGNAGNSIVDRLASMADSGELERDPNWTPSADLGSADALPPDSSSSALIRNPLAYAATAKGNQARVTQALQAVRDHGEMDPVSKSVLGSGIAKLGNTSNRAEAEALTSDTLAKLGKVNPDWLPYGTAILNPLAAQVR